MTVLSAVLAALEVDHPPDTAEPWDAVGLVCGDPDVPVSRVLFAVDPVQEVADQALATGCELLVTHHPLYLRGTSSVAATTPKGRLVHALVRGGCALYVAHTNADRSATGVNVALADLFGLLDPEPLDASGLGRVGALPEPLTLRVLTDLAAEVLPSTAWGVRTAGDPDRVVRRLAVCGGSGDSLLLAAAGSGADAFLTSDLRHHPASEAPAGLALLDAAHWATEWPWLPVAAARLAAQTGLATEVSRLVTDPFRMSSRSPCA